MSIYLIIGLVSLVVLLGFIVWGVKTEWESTFVNMAIIVLVCLVLVFGIIGIFQSFSLRKEMIRQEKERQQIVYQIENIKEDSDRVKLNEWILTYNDWVNDVNTSKEMFGLFSWYHTVDMSKHTIIPLV